MASAPPRRFGVAHLLTALGLGFVALSFGGLAAVWLAGVWAQHVLARRVCAELPGAAADPLLRAHPYPYAYLVAKVEERPDLRLDALDSVVVAWTSREVERDPLGATVAVHYAWAQAALWSATVDLYEIQRPDGSTHIAVSESGSSVVVRCGEP